MRLRIFPLSACLLAMVASSPAQDPPQKTDPQTTEKVTVRLILVDTLVMNKQGETVPGLTKDDFRLKIGDQPVKIDTFDAFCPIGAVPDPDKDIPTKGKEKPPAPIGPGIDRKIVLAFDYSFLPVTDRQGVLNAAKAMVSLLGTDKEEIMVVALTGAVRVEQKFTSDRQEVIRSLNRMEYDKSLWPIEFPVGASGRGYFKAMTTLMDVLAGYPGSKAVVLFSELQSLGAGGQFDLWYSDVATHAAAAQAVIYPSMATGLQVSSGAGTSDALARFANQSGGRMTMMGEDLSVAYRRAQRDLSCRYTLGTYVDPDKGRSNQNVRVELATTGDELRFPEMTRLFTEAELRDSRTGAAFVDPGPYENPLVRLTAFPAHPQSADSWDTLLAVHFPMPYHLQGGNFDVEATMRRGATNVGKFQGQFSVPPAEKKDQARPVTVMGDTNLKSGQYTFTVVLSNPDGDQVVSAATDVTVPSAPEGLLILRGPLLARVQPGGTLIHAKAKGKDEPTKIDQILGPDTTFEPLVVHEIESSEDLLTYWNACVYGKSQLHADAMVHRRFVGSDGSTVHELDPVPLQLESTGKKVACQDDLERIAAGTLAAGEYRFEVVVSYANSGDLLGRGTVPLHVK